MASDAGAGTPGPELLPAGPVAFITALARPHRFLFLASLSAAAASAVLSIGPVLAISAMAGAVMKGTATGSLTLILALAALAATAGHLLLAAAATLGGHKIAFAIQRELRLRLLAQIIRAPVSKVEGRAGEMKKIFLADVDRLEGLLAHILPDMVSGLAAPLAGGVILAVIDWRLLIAALALLPIAYAAQVWTYRGRSALFEEWNEAEAKANTALLSYVRGIATLRAFNRQASTLENVRPAVHALRDMAVLITRKSRYSYTLFGSALSANLMVVLPIAMLLHMRGEIGTPGFILAVTLGASLVAPLNKVVFATLIAARSSIAIARIRSILETPILPDESAAALPQGNAIRFENVGFAYPDGREALTDIDLRFPEGGLTAIVGPSGAGKSTLARLILRLEDCTSGRITLGGIDVRHLPLAQLRRRLAAVFQDSLLFHGTIAANVGMAAPGATDEALAVALRRARADEISGDLTTTLQLDLNDRGIRLSGGEKQRVAIARALLKETPILVLDEATSFVDALNDDEILSAIGAASEGKTVIVIAHGLRSIRAAGQIVVLNAGRVEAVGKHDDLLVRSPTYQALHEAQEKASGWKLGGCRETRMGAA